MTNTQGPSDPNDRFGKIAVGALIGTAAAAGAAWVSQRSREITRSGPPALISWDRVRQTAFGMNANPTQGVVGNHRTVSAREWRTYWQEYYENLVGRTIPLIEEYTHATLPNHQTDVRVQTRNEWVDANIENFKGLFEPIEKVNQEAASKTSPIGAAVMGTVNQTLVSTELGVLLGYLCRRVLGQYDMSVMGRTIIGEDQPEAGRIYFVEQNINGVQTNTGLRDSTDDFRLWITLHEMTHAFEFEAYPWMREHFNSLIARYFSYVVEDLTNAGSSGGNLSSIIARLREKDEGPWLEKVMTPRQRDLFQELQALMSIVEGYANHVMNAVGHDLMPSFDEIKKRLEVRSSQTSIIDKLFARLTGLGLKMEQYKQGEAFCNAVVEKKGIIFANKMWEGPENLPTLDEVRNPDLWITRMESAAAY